MPIINDQLILGATNKALAKLSSSVSLFSLESPEMSSTEWSCTDFASKTLEYVLKELNVKNEPDAKLYNGDRDPKTWPSSFSEHSFVNFSIRFKDSTSDHNFNVYFDKNDSCYLIQTYLKYSIRISTPQRSTNFISLWKQLCTKDWAVAYETLFYVKPNTKDNNYSEQFVSVVTAN